MVICTLLSNGGNGVGIEHAAIHGHGASESAVIDFQQGVPRTQMRCNFALTNQ